MKLTILLILFFLSFTVQSQGLTSLLTDQNSQKTEKAPLPNVGAMEPRWFLFLDELNRDNYKKDISNLKIKLKEIYNNLDRKQKKEISPVIEKINFGLGYYVEQKFSDLKKTSIKIEEGKENYDLKGFYNFLNSLYSLRLERNELEFDINDLGNKISEDQNSYEDLFAAYLKLENNSSAKVMAGFRIINIKIKLLIDNLKQKNQRELFKEINTDYENKTKQLREIDSRVTVTPSDNVWVSKRKKESSRVLDVYKRSQKEKNSRSKESYYFGNKKWEASVEESYFKLIDLNNALLSYIFSIKDGISNEGLKVIEEELKVNKQIREEIARDLKIWEQRIKRLLRSLEKGNSNSAIISELISKTQEISKELWVGINLIKVLDKISFGAESALKSKAVIFWDKLTFVFSELTNLLSKSIFTLGDAPVTILGIVNVILIIFISLYLSRGVRYSIDRISQKKFDINPSSLYILSRLSHYVILSIGVMFGLSSIGIDFSNVALVAGALTVGIGFGLQSIFNNFVSGLILLFERPLRVGDYVQLESGLRGEVQEINVRSTRITTRDNIDVLVPNSEFINTRVINWTLHDHARRVHVPFGVAYGTDKELVKKAVLEASYMIDSTITNDPRRAPEVWLTEFADSSLNFELVVWVSGPKSKKDRIDVDYLWEIETKFREYNIEIPFPQRDVHLKTVPKNFISS